VLAEHKVRQARERQRAGGAWEEHGLVFASRTGRQLDAGNVRRTLRLALEAADLPSDWTPRELRHSFVSIMSASGAPVELIARLVGHSTTATTERVYRKELRPVITEGAEIMGAMFAAGRETSEREP
jgi:site-specific recombinase XerD